MKPEPQEPKIPQTQETLKPKIPQTPEAPDPSFGTLKTPELPLAPIVSNSRLYDVVENDLNILRDQASRLQQTWNHASPFDIDGVCKLMNMTFKLIEMRRRVLLLPLGAADDKNRKRASQTSYDSLYDD